MKTAIITGASKGIGRAISIALAKEHIADAFAIICKNNTKELEATADIMRSYNCTVYTYTCDIGSYDEVSSTIESIMAETGSIDILINNAAISHVGLLSDMTPSEWQASVNTNLSSVFNTCKSVVPHMIKKHSGKIINISSVWGLVGASCEVAYSATKGGVNAFTQALAKELAPSNITVNAIAFGAVDTTMNGHLSETEKAELCEEIPIGRMCTPEEAADSVIGLIKMPAYLTGEIIKVDGAWI